MNKFTKKEKIIKVITFPWMMLNIGIALGAISCHLGNTYLT